MRFRTRSIHVGNEKDPLTGSVVPPIYSASTFVQPAAGEFGEFDIDGITLGVPNRDARGPSRWYRTTRDRHLEHQA